MHLHDVIDSDKKFSINPVTRTIENASGKIKIVQNDHNSERFTFEIPRLVDGHDMRLCDKIEIHYFNVSTNKKYKSEDVYPVDDATVDEWDENKVMFSWLISGNATRYAGSLNFLISFKCLTGDKIEYAWHTEIFKDITVSDGMNNGEAVIVEYSDVLEAWKNDILSTFDAEFDIVQSKGDGRGKVMSQKVVTDEFNRADKRITNLERGILPSPFVTDDSVARVKSVPSNALPYAEIDKVGGMTRKCANLLPYPYTSKAGILGGITITINGDGSVSFRGTSDANFNNFIFSDSMRYQHGKTYTCASGVTVSYKDAAGTTQYAGKTFVWDEAYTPLLAYFSIRPNTVYDTTVYPMINEGREASPYELYFEGLRSAKVTDIEIVGKNLYDVKKFSEAYPNSIKVENGVVDVFSFESEMYSKGVPVNIPVGYSISLLPVEKENQSKSGRLKINFEDGSFTQINITGTNCETLGRQILTITKPVISICFDLVDLNNGYSFKDFQIEKGTVATDYVPYSKHSVTIPSEIQYLDGYGQSNPDNAEEYNYIDWERRVFVAYGHIVDGSWVAFDTVQETDITDILTADNFIEVEGGGIVTMVNEYGYDVPSEITYMLKGVAV